MSTVGRRIAELAQCFMPCVGALVKGALVTWDEAGGIVFEGCSTAGRPAVTPNACEVVMGGLSDT